MTLQDCVGIGDGVKISLCRMMNNCIGYTGTFFIVLKDKVKINVVGHSIKEKTILLRMDQNNQKYYYIYNIVENSILSVRRHHVIYGNSHTYC